MLIVWKKHISFVKRCLTNIRYVYFKQNYFWKNLWQTNVQIKLIEKGIHLTRAAITKLKKWVLIYSHSHTICENDICSHISKWFKTLIFFDWIWTKMNKNNIFWVDISCSTQPGGIQCLQNLKRSYASWFILGHIYK